MLKRDETAGRPASRASSKKDTIRLSTVEKENSTNFFSFFSRLSRKRRHKIMDVDDNYSGTDDASTAGSSTVSSSGSELSFLEDLCIASLCLSSRANRLIVTHIFLNLNNV